MDGAELRMDRIQDLLASWDSLIQDFPDDKRRTLEGIGREILELVRQEIGGTGTVAGWQEPHLGSGGGYVAVRPKANTYKITQSGKKYAVGHVTNAIEGGHPIRRPAVAGAKGYRPRATVAAVPGRWFYRVARQRLAGLDHSEIDTLMERIRAGLEGTR